MNSVMRKGICGNSKVKHFHVTKPFPGMPKKRVEYYLAHCIGTGLFGERDDTYRSLFDAKSQMDGWDVVLGSVNPDTLIDSDLLLTVGRETVTNVFEDMGFDPDNMPKMPGDSRTSWFYIKSQN